MLRIVMPCLLLAGCLAAFGCEKKGPPTPVEKTADRKAAEANVQNKQAVDASVAAAEAKRDEYAVAMRKRLDELDVKYAELQRRAEKSEGEMKTELDKQVAQARVKRDAAAVKLEELKTASAERWEKIKDGVGNAFDDLKTAFE
jgi:membrane-bound lytic murein transglycosylase B